MELNIAEAPVKSAEFSAFKVAYLVSVMVAGLSVAGVFLA